MKIRFFRVVCFLSAAWLIFLLVIFDKNNDKLIDIVIIGWPSIVGFILSYVVTGSFFWPKNKN